MLSSPDPGDEPAPSLPSLPPFVTIQTLPKSAQSLIFLTTMSSLVVGTLIGSDVIARAESLPVLGALLTSWHGTLWLLGPIFVAAGVSHFFVNEFEDIYPEPGTWGIWYLPGSAKFHVAWTGVAEILGGAGLIAGHFADLPQVSATVAALLLALAWGVYPANLHMATHGKQLPAGVEMDNGAHIGRYAAQIALQTALLTLVRVSLN
ncbi:hypothetical protein TeGR_g1247 [Tetraparma gracilis]|uniref:DoxX family protein n=1 Tax=Tetraparma gracilis TaxID=2962635 RepID=A0ABQ6MD34_9STRA|nr:hypothetical protein TeGR_g1247 [Tetraparma gracilis]